MLGLPCWWVEVVRLFSQTRTSNSIRHSTRVIIFMMSTWWKLAILIVTASRVCHKFTCVVIEITPAFFHCCIISLGSHRLASFWTLRSTNHATTRCGIQFESLTRFRLNWSCAIFTQRWTRQHLSFLLGVLSRTSCSNRLEGSEKRSILRWCQWNRRIVLTRRLRLRPIQSLSWGRRRTTSNATSRD